MGKTKPPVILTDEMVKGALKAKIEKRVGRGAMTMAEKDILYLRGMFDVLKATIEPMVEAEADNNSSSERSNGHGRPYRYTPRQMWENTKKYFEISIEYGQPLTVTAISMFNDIDRMDLMGEQIKKLAPQYRFMEYCVRFVVMYNEYAAHKRQNPAGPIFILKNFGWKDKIDIEAHTTPGALTEAERMEAQRRIANFSEETKEIGTSEPVPPKTEE